MATRSGRRRSTSQPTVTTAPTCCGDSSDRDTYAMVSVLSMNDEQILSSRFIPSLASIPPRPQLANIFRGPLICVFYLELSVQIVALLSDAYKSDLLPIRDFTWRLEDVKYRVKEGQSFHVKHTIPRNPISPTS